MLHFFRKVRRKLIGQGRLRNYLAYAGGEIALIMIGILLALQINNWNARRVQEASFLSLLEQIYNAIHTDTETKRSVVNALIYQVQLIDSLLFRLEAIPERQILPMLSYLEEELPPSSNLKDNIDVGGVIEEAIHSDDIWMIQVCLYF